MTGDQADILARIKRALPPWFGQVGLTPVLDGLLSGPAAAFAGLYALYVYAQQQTRLLTMSGGWLDLFAQDFFGSSIVRKNNQPDGSFLAVIQANLFRERGTRRAVINVLTAITGQAPIVFEPASVIDTGAMSSPLSAGFFGVARFGSYAVPFTAMVIAYRPKISGGLAGAAYIDEPSISGMATPLSIGFLGSLSLEQSAASDADIYAAVDSVRPIAVTVWTAITNAPAPVRGANAFILDNSKLDGTNVLL